MENLDWLKSVCAICGEPRDLHETSKIVVERRLHLGDKFEDYPLCKRCARNQEFHGIVIIFNNYVVFYRLPDYSSGDRGYKQVFPSRVYLLEKLEFRNYHP